MKENVESLVQELKVASGQEQADLHITNLRILDVFTETMFGNYLQLEG